MTEIVEPRAAGDTSAQGTKALWCRCADCSHCWAAAYYPMDLKKFAKIAKAHSSCPKCGGKGMVAKQNDGELLEPACEAS